MVHAYTLNYYDYRRGFNNTNRGWYEHVVYTESKATKMKIIEWLYNHVENPERHCRWCNYDDKLCVKFRHQKDYLWFSLSF